MDGSELQDSGSCRQILEYARGQADNERFDLVHQGMSPNPFGLGHVSDLPQADEASHRGVNHTLANLDQVSDPNPFIEGHSNMNHMHLAAVRPAGLEREEVLEKYAR